MFFTLVVLFCLHTVSDLNASTCIADGGYFLEITLHEILPLRISVKVLKFLGPPLHYLYVP